MLFELEMSVRCVESRVHISNEQMNLKSTTTSSGIIKRDQIEVLKLGSLIFRD